MMNILQSQLERNGHPQKNQIGSKKKILCNLLEIILGYGFICCLFVVLGGNIMEKILV